jgi:hypothetical protein
MKRLLLIALSPLLFVLPAQSAIIYSGLQNIAIPTDFNGIYIDIDDASTSLSDFAGADINPFFGGSGLYNSASFQPVRSGTNFDDAIVRLDSGTLVSSSSVYSLGVGISGSPNNHVGLGANQFFPGMEGYMGFKFTTNGSAGPFYGWMRVVFTSNTAGGVIKDWAYDNTGAPIIVPEPGRAVLLLFGLAYASTVRRRRLT